MTFGKELIAQLEREIENYRTAMNDRAERINAGLTDMDDCFVSQRVEERGLELAKDKIALINDGGCAWFTEYATLDGQLVKAKWCNTKYGRSLRAEMPNGQVVWTTASTQNGLAKKGLKKVLVKRPAWFCFESSGTGLWGAYTGSYVLFASDYNYATGEYVGSNYPVEVKDWEKGKGVRG